MSNYFCLRSGCPAGSGPVWRDGGEWAGRCWRGGPRSGWIQLQSCRRDAWEPEVSPLPAYIHDQRKVQSWTLLGGYSAFTPVFVYFCDFSACFCHSDIEMFSSFYLCNFHIFIIKLYLQIYFLISFHKNIILLWHTCCFGHLLLFLANVLPILSF